MRRNRVRDIIRDSKKTQPYESRNSIRRKNRVNQIVAQIVGLAGAEDDLTNRAAVEEIIDKYYQPEELPSADTITELLGGWENPKKVIVMGAVAVLVVSLCLYYY